MMPGLGKFNSPVSMLTWDVIVLNGFAINVYICGYLLYKRFRAQPPVAKMYMPAVFLSIVWAISIHTVTAFLYCGLGGRPFWNTALLAPRFLASAFVSGPVYHRRHPDHPLANRAHVCLVIGALSYLVGWAGGKFGFNPSFVSAVLVLVPVVVTGGIHVDGLLDTSDALSLWQERERRLEILKDSHAGAFAVITACAFF